MSFSHKTALITGVTGQDGSYLAELLIDKGYDVHGIKRRSSSFNTSRIDHIYEDPNVDQAKFKLHYGDLSDTSNITRLLSEIRPDEVYNLGAQSHVAVSFESPRVSCFFSTQHRHSRYLLYAATNSAQESATHYPAHPHLLCARKFSSYLSIYLPV